MKDLDLKYHKVRLVIIRNRFSIMYGSTLFLYTFFFVLGILLLGRISDVVNRIEDNQKAEACILQLARKDRTTVKITDCVNRNSSKPKDFKFNSSGGSGSSTSHSSIPKSTISSTTSVTPPKIQTTTVHVTETTSPVIEPPTKPKPIITQPVRTILYRINVLGQQECQLVGDTLWTLAVSGVCP